MATILDGKVLAASIRLKLREEAALLPRRPGIAVILVGDAVTHSRYEKSKLYSADFSTEYRDAKK